MRHEFFYKNYDLYDANIIKMEIVDKKLYLKLSENTHLELIANGYRPELDCDYIHTYIFDVENSNHKFKNHKIDKYDFKDNKLLFIVDGIEILFTSLEISVI